MIPQFDIVVLSLVILSAGVSLFIRDLMGAVIAFGAYSFLMCIVWTGMGAVDVAFTEAAVGAGVSTVFFIATIYNISRISKPRIKKAHFFSWSSALIVLVTGLLLGQAVLDFPIWGDPQSPVNSHVSAYYVEHAIEDTAVPNVVTAVLADYRGFDTMFETCVVFVAVIAIAILLRRRRDYDHKPPYQSGNSLVIRMTSYIVVPLMQLFALYVVAHGHHSPGGGFQGGVILGASFILLSMATDLKTVMKRLSEKWILLCVAIGVLIYAGWGALSLIFGGNFLDYSVLHHILPATDAIMARSHSMLIVEIGVAFTVMAGMFGIYAHLASDGHLEKGL